MALSVGTGASASPFTAGNIVVYRMGDGSTADTLTNAGTAVFLDEYTTGGSFVQSVMMPTNFFGGYYPLIGNGSASADGLMTLSKDGRFLIVPGFGTLIGGGSSALGGISSTTVPRIYATVDGNGRANTTTAQTNSFSSAESPRSAASTDGTNLWISGDSSGLRYTTRGSYTATQLATFVTNLRQVNIYSNVLTFSDASGSSIRLGYITNAMPVTTSGSWMDSLGTNLPTSTGSPYGFVLTFLPGGPSPYNTLYYADDTSPGTIYKYCLVSGTWQAKGSMTASNVRGMTGSSSGGNTTLYVTTAPAAPTSGEYTGGGYLLSYTDTTGYNADMTGNGGDISDNASWANATPNRKVLRGVAFAPQGSEAFPSGDGQISVGPLAGLTTSGLIGGSFGTKDYSIGNPGTNTVTWSASVDSNWVSFSSSSGSLAAGATNNVTISINANASSLPAGTYIATVTFTNTTAGSPLNGSDTTTRPVTLIITDNSLTPSTDFTASGPPGGPFTPANKAYTLTNGANAFNWTAGSNTNLFTVTPTSGSLGAFASTIITVAVNTAVANPLPAGSYSGTIAFSNSTSSTLIATRSATLLDGSTFWSDDFSTYSSGNVVGQNGWLQLGSTTVNPLQITGGALVYAGGLTAAGQTAYKDFPLQSNQTVYVGMRMTITSAVTNGASGVNAGPSYVTTVYQNNSGTINGGFPNYRFTALSLFTNQSNFCLGARPNGQATGPWQFTTNAPTPFNPVPTGTVVNVILATGGAGGTNVLLYVNPTSATESANTTNLNSGGPVTPVPTAGSFGLSQFGTASVPSTGAKFYKIAVSTNFAEVYNFITTAPTANFTATPTNGTAPLTVNFTDTSAGSPIFWNWNFGDSSTSAFENPSHTYTTAGVYTVQLIASNGVASSTNSKTAYITVTPAGTPPTASFGASPLSGVEPLTVTFTNTSTGTAPITSYWTLGDGVSVTNTGANVSHAYAAGTYTVSLLASNTLGTSTATSNNLISVITVLQSWSNAYGVPGNNADADGDGVSNTNEFLTGFNPTNGSAYVHVLSVQTVGSDMKITYLGANGDSSYAGGPSSRTNVLEYTAGSGGNYSTNDFTSTGQTNVLNGGSGVGTTTNMTDSGGATNVPARYYRVRVLAP